MFPVAMLHGILQANDMVLEFFRTYLRQSLAILEQMQQPTPLAPFLAPMDWMRAMMPPTLPFPAAFPSTAAAESHEELNSRISAMEERIKRLEQPSQSARKIGSVHPSSLAIAAIKESAALDRLEKRLTELEAGDESE